MGRVYRRAAARRDLIEHFVHLAETAGESRAKRFLDGAQANFDHLAAQPMIRAPVKLQSPSLTGMRK
jgi:toxin ParE1/3/4